MGDRPTRTGRVPGRHHRRRRAGAPRRGDRPWTPRNEASKRTCRGYLYGATHDGDGFFAATSYDPATDRDGVLGGWVLRAGEAVPMRGGTRVMRWRGDGGWAGWGEDRDSWSPALLRAFRRAHAGRKGGT